MASVWNDNALDEALRQVVNKSPPSPIDLYLRLFTNNFTVSNTDAIGAYTQCVDASYAAIHLTGATWSLSSISGGRQADYASQTFTFAGGVSLYGWYLTDSANTTVYAAGNFASAPIVIPGGGGTLGVAVSLPAITP